LGSFKPAKVGGKVAALGQGGGKSATPAIPGASEEAAIAAEPCNWAG
jgi:hypothetical protein